MTITDELSIDDRCAEMDAESQAGDSMVGSLSSDPDLADATSRAVGVRGVVAPECRSTRAAMYDYLGRLLPPHRARRLEVHMDGCAGCIRAFIDIREVSWTRRTVADSATLTVTRAGTAEHVAGTS